MTSPKRINLALQGGGSHGAFTWGVLDTLLADERLDIAAVSGTSAGAMNAAIMLQGWSEGGRQGAIGSLRAFWTDIGALSAVSPVRRSPLDRLQGNWNLDDSPTAIWLDYMQRTFSLWQRNPLHLDPLRDIVKRHFNQDAVRACADIKLFVAATNVETGKVRIFTRADISLDALLASACLPNAQDAVIIDGVPYWDGGFRGNPAIWPFIYESDSRDVVLVELNPQFRKGVPRSNAQVADRLNEITFNSALIDEMRAIAFVCNLIDKGALSGPEATRFRPMLIHSIANDEAMGKLGAVSKSNIEPEFLDYMFKLGRQAAADWLAAHFERVGVESTVDIVARFL